MKRTAKSSATRKRAKLSVELTALNGALFASSRWSDLERVLTPEARAAFCKFMRGQTCGVSDSGESIIYGWDFERWVKQGCKDDQGSDWD